MKKVLSIFLSFLLILPATSTIFSEASTKLSSASNDINLTLAEFLDLPFSAQKELVDEYKESIFPSTGNSNMRYKSSDENLTHTSVTMVAFLCLTNNKGFWATNTDALEIIFLASTYAAAPDLSDDEAYTASNTDHFYVPRTGKGLYGGTSASERFVEYYDKALNAQRNNDPLLAAQHLGRALHYLQDVTVPHHTISILTIAHAAYEKFCSTNIDTLLDGKETTNSLYYSDMRTKQKQAIVPYIAAYSNTYYDDVDSSLFQGHWDVIAETLMEYAVDQTAAMLYRFSLDAGLTLTN